MSNEASSTSDPLLCDSDLIRKWLHAQSCRRHHCKNSGTYLWSKIVDTFCVGSTVAHQVCRKHGFDPDMRVPKR